MRSLLLRIMLLVLSGTFITAQRAAKSQEASITLPPSLARVLTDYERGWKAGDAAALAQLFTEDGFVLSPGQQPVKGRGAIQKLYTGPGSPLSLRAFKRVIFRANAFRRTIEHEDYQAEVARIAKSEDVAEGVAAMREKRPPRFQGK